MSNRPKVLFLIPIASARAVADWRLGSSFLQQTLASIFNSSNGNFCVAVAGHEPPDCVLPQDSRFKFISLDHPIPPREKMTYDDRVRDKMAKLSAGWEYAKANWNPEYVMKVDWDDFISSKLVGWLASGNNEAGYTIKNGWSFETGARYLVRQMDKFDDLCGSCLVIRSDLADRTGPFLINVEGDRARVTDHHSLFSWAAESTLLLNDQHHRAEAYFKYLGHQLATIPFRAAIYRTANPISLSDAGRKMQVQSLRMLLGRIRRTRFITGNFRREFMLP